jgi:hypothetical protein
VVNVKRAKAPQKVIRQIELSSLKDLNQLHVKARRVIKDIIEGSRPDPSQMKLAGSQVRERTDVSTG